MFSAFRYDLFVDPLFVCILVEAVSALGNKIVDDIKSNEPNEGSTIELLKSYLIDNCSLWLCIERIWM